MAKNFGDGAFTKRHNNFYTIIGKIGDIIFYPIIILSLICCAVIFVSKQENKVPSIFGISLVCITSGSMTKGGFEKGHVVILHSEAQKDLRAGEIIAFYYPGSSGAPSKSKLTLVQSYDRDTLEQSDYNLPEPTQEDDGDRLTKDEVIKKKAKVYFHRIVAIYVDDAGVFYFETQGDSNPNFEKELVCGDYVVGEYVNTPEWIRGIFTFVSSALGIILLLIVPLGILMLFILFSIIEQISRMGIEGRVIRRELRYDDPESIKADIGIEMEELDKIKFFVDSPENERQGVAEFLRSYLQFGNKKEQEKYKSIKYAVENFEELPHAYWKFWISAVRGKRKKAKVEKLWRQWELQNQSKKNFNATRQKTTKPKNED